MARIAVVLFPGSNCEQDVVYALRREGGDAELVWHAEADLRGADGIVLPGGFAHGDYLRPGAVARFSPVMDAVRDVAARDGLVLGICNGFQILAEAGLVPGALMRNRGLRFLCAWTDVVVEDVGTPFTSGCQRGQVLRIPINHYEGSYVPPRDSRARVVFRYRENPNGAWESVAGVANASGNVLGLMPHPERASEEWLGSTDGRLILSSMVSALERTGVGG